MTIAQSNLTGTRNYLSCVQSIHCSDNNSLINAITSVVVLIAWS